MLHVTSPEGTGDMSSANGFGWYWVHISVPAPTQSRCGCDGTLYGCGRGCVCVCPCLKEGRKEMFYLTTHSTHFIYGYMASDIW